MGEKASLREEAWREASFESGICILCAKCRPDCLRATQGWVCHDCLQKALRNPEPAKIRITVMPELSQHGYALQDPDGTYVTVGGTLYFYRREEDALDLLEMVRKSDPGCGTRVSRLATIIPWLYVAAHPELRMLCIREVVRRST